MTVDAFKYYQDMIDTETILAYCGPVWAASVEELSETLLKRLELAELSVSASHSIFSVFVEQMNNISMHSADKDTFVKQNEKTLEVARGILIFGTVGDKYFLQCGNVIHEHSCEILKSRIDYLNSLDRQGLLRYYKELLHDVKANPESKGAGLGLVEIAKRASSRIEYSFTPMERGLYFFTMFVEI